MAECKADRLDRAIAALRVFIVGLAAFDAIMAPAALLRWART